MYRPCTIMRNALSVYGALSGPGPRTPRNSTSIWNGLGNNASLGVGKSTNELLAGYGHLFGLDERTPGSQQPVRPVWRPSAYLDRDPWRVVGVGRTCQRPAAPVTEVARPAQACSGPSRG